MRCVRAEERLTTTEYADVTADTCCYSISECGVMLNKGVEASENSTVIDNLGGPVLGGWTNRVVDSNSNPTSEKKLADASPRAGDGVPDTCN